MKEGEERVKGADVGLIDYRRRWGVSRNDQAILQEATLGQAASWIKRNCPEDRAEGFPVFNAFLRYFVRPFLFILSKDPLPPSRPRGWILRGLVEGRLLFRCIKKFTFVWTFESLALREYWKPGSIWTILTLLNFLKIQFLDVIFNLMCRCFAKEKNFFHNF